MARPTGRGLRIEIVAVATDLIQTVGIAAFSYGDLAIRLGIKAPSVHHYFRTKEDLVSEVVLLYRQQFALRVSEIPDGNSCDRLGAYGALFANTAEQDRFCLCGAAAAEWSDLGTRPQEQVGLFFDEQLNWISNELKIGIRSKELIAHLDARSAAQTYLAALEGSLLMARAGAGSEIVRTTSQAVLSLFKRR